MADKETDVILLDVRGVKLTFRVPENGLVDGEDDTYMTENSGDLRSRRMDTLLMYADIAADELAARRALGGAAEEAQRQGAVEYSSGVAPRSVDTAAPAQYQQGAGGVPTMVQPPQYQQPPPYGVPPSGQYVPQTAQQAPRVCPQCGYVAAQVQKSWGAAYECTNPNAHGRPKPNGGFWPAIVK